jgi:deoxycytidine triphosphate deaminase
MARKLSDKEIENLLEDVIRGGSKDLLNPNGIELRLGDHVRYLSTSEQMKVPPGHFIKVRSGEMVMVNSLETLDFSKETIQKHFPGCMLMAWITPTTTMVREGIIQAATKVDAGFCGQLNWGFRNSSFKDLILQNGESIFKLTLELLEGLEIPRAVYGERETDKYQDTSGVLVSRRKIFADTPADKTISSSFDKIDPKTQLREAGPPFNYVGSELVALQGKFEIVSRNFSELSQKIETETSSVVGKIEELKKWTVEQIDHIFSRKFGMVVGTLIGGFTIMYGVLQFIKGFSPSPAFLTTVALLVGVVIILASFILTRRTK